MSALTAAHEVTNEQTSCLNRDFRSLKLYVAPMVLQSELAFRVLCRKYNKDIVTYTPMLSSKQFVRDKTYRDQQFQTANDDRPLIAQFAGNDAQTLIAAARLIQTKVDAIDLNFGCPENVARKGNYGAFLMKDPNKVVDIVRQMVDALKPLPVTCKIRLAEYGNHIPEHRRGLQGTISLCQSLEAVGCSLVCVHGRTRHNKGKKISKADLDAIRSIKRCVTSMPIISNGNIGSPMDCIECLNITGADGVMSAEAILGNPSLYRSLTCIDGTLHQKKLPILPPSQIAYDYLDCVEIYPPYDMIKVVKPHLYRILHGLFPYDKELLGRLQKCEKNVEDYRSCVDYATRIETQLLDYLSYEQNSVGLKESFLGHLHSSYYLRHREQRNSMASNIIFDKHKQFSRGLTLKSTQNEQREKQKEDRRKWIEAGGVRISR